ncbi:RNA polymerase, sigma subunit, ECF family [Filimonas lacunae]|uniref:RNA polymerase, sigma subunit, ECF family n=1 Tax=Filimonas lacunae TaxID=477680 RepID=A0A173MQN9_9BACT|nr:sigma-70 family RNA polymerase sigma factor [Filimonas lacunae]BAV09691.1 RNA polymerase ECF-type sigma factor [Filimonas lacunae]SIS77314.1 RNA polymerase, sigma subunit, ECF family [Filimonas lacunae]
MENQNVSYQEDKLLFSRIADGDEEAFNILFHAYVPRLHPLIMKITRNEGVVKDLLQEIFFYLWLDRESLGAIESPQNWIFKIAYNRIYTWMSRQAVRNQKEGAALPLQQATGEHMPEQTVSFRETARLIQEAVAELPPQARKIFQLSRDADLKAAEVASLLGISVQTVRNSLVRSVKHIKEYLNKYGIYLPSILILFFL